MNNYVIVSNDKINIDYTIKSLIKKINCKELEIIKCNYPETTIESVLDMLNTFNFLCDKKLVIYNDCSFLSKDQDKEIHNLKKYLQNTGDNYLIMINDTISEKKDIKELLRGNIEIIKDSIEPSKIITDNLDEYKMDNKTINYFINYCLNNNEKIINELDKLKSYKYLENDKTITIDDINKVVIRDYDDDIFDLVNSIVKKNKNKAFELYYRISSKEKDSTNIIASVSGSIRNMYSSKVLYENKYKQSEISEILGIKPYAVSISLENSGNYSSKKLLNLLNILSDMDYKIKSGNGQAKTLFEIFLLSL